MSRSIDPAKAGQPATMADVAVLGLHVELIGSTVSLIVNTLGINGDARMAEHALELAEDLDLLKRQIEEMVYRD